MFGALFGAFVAGAAIKNNVKQSNNIVNQTRTLSWQNGYCVNRQWYNKHTKEKAYRGWNIYGEEMLGSESMYCLMYNQLHISPNGNPHWMHEPAYTKNIEDAVRERKDYFVASKSRKTLYRDLRTGERMTIITINGSSFFAHPDSLDFIKYVDGNQKEIDIVKYSIAKSVWHILCKKAYITIKYSYPLWFCMDKEYNVGRNRKNGFELWGIVSDGIDFCDLTDRDYDKFEAYLIEKVNDSDWDGKKYMYTQRRKESDYLTVEELKNYYRNVKIMDAEKLQIKKRNFLHW